MLSKLFSNNVAFAILIIIIWGGLILAVTEFRSWEASKQQVKESVIQNLTDLDAAFTQQKEMLDQESHLHITMDDVRRVCRDMEKVNPGWKCPEINGIKSHDYSKD